MPVPAAFVLEIVPGKLNTGLLPLMLTAAPVGLLTRLAAIPLLIDISVAILSTKIPILLGQGFWMFTLPKVPRYGFSAWCMRRVLTFPCFLGCSFCSSSAAESGRSMRKSPLPASAHMQRNKSGTCFSRRPMAP